MTITYATDGPHTWASIGLTHRLDLWLGQWTDMLRQAGPLRVWCEGGGLYWVRLDIYGEVGAGIVYVVTL